MKRNYYAIDGVGMWVGGLLAFIGCIFAMTAGGSLGNWTAALVLWAMSAGLLHIAGKYRRRERQLETITRIILVEGSIAIDDLAERLRMPVLEVNRLLLLIEQHNREFIQLRPDRVSLAVSGSRELSGRCESCGAPVFAHVEAHSPQPACRYCGSAVFVNEAMQARGELLGAVRERATAAAAAPQLNIALLIVLLLFVPPAGLVYLVVMLLQSSGRQPAGALMRQLGQVSRGPGTTAEPPPIPPSDDRLQQALMDLRRTVVESVERNRRRRENR